MLIAKQDTVARALRRAWESRNVRKIYFAIVHGHIKEEGGKISEPLGRDLDSHVAIKDCVRPDGLAAETSFRLLRHFERDQRPFSYLQVEPHSGRKHQIRIHLAHIGYPIVGDKIYGGNEESYLAFVEGRLSTEQKQRLILTCHALHARSVCWIRMERSIEFWCDPGEAFKEFLAHG